MRVLFSHRAYRELLLGQLVRQVGVFATLLLLTHASWHRESPGFAGLVALLAALPGLAGPLVLGALSDRVGRRGLLNAVQLVEAGLITATGIALGGGAGGWVLAALATLLGTTNALHTPLFQASSVEVAPRGLEASAAVGMGWSNDGGKLLGAGLVGIALSLDVTFTACVWAGVASAIAVVCNRHAPVRAAARAARSQQVAVPWRRLRPLTGAYLLGGLSLTQIGLVLVALAGSAEPARLGVLGAAFSAGACLGTWALTSHARIRVRHLVRGFALTGCGLVLAGAVGVGSEVSLLLSVAYGFGLGYCYQGLPALALPLVPAGVRGRYAGATTLVEGCAKVAGAGMFGLAASGLGVSWALAGAGCTGGMCALALWWGTKSALRDAERVVLPTPRSAAEDVRPDRERTHPAAGVHARR